MCLERYGTHFDINVDKSALSSEYFHRWEFFKVGNINRKVNIIKAPAAGLEFIAYRFLVNVLTYGMVFCNKTRGMG